MALLLFCKQTSFLLAAIGTLKSNHDNPTHKVVFEPLYKDEFLKREKVIPPFSLCCEADINCLDCDQEDVANYKISEVPLWTSKSPTYLCPTRVAQW